MGIQCCKYLASFSGNLLSRLLCCCTFNERMGNLTRTIFKERCFLIKGKKENSTMLCSSFTLSAFESAITARYSNNHAVACSYISVTLNRNMCLS